MWVKDAVRGRPIARHLRHTWYAHLRWHIGAMVYNATDVDAMFGKQSGKQNETSTRVCLADSTGCLSNRSQLLMGSIFVADLYTRLVIEMHRSVEIMCRRCCRIRCRLCGVSHHNLAAVQLSLIIHN